MQGLGKTVQIAAFLSAVMGKTATSEDKRRMYPLPECDCRQALIVVPTTTLSNWQRELSIWGCFKVSIPFSAIDLLTCSRLTETCSTRSDSSMDLVERMLFLQQESADVRSF